MELNKRSKFRGIKTGQVDIKLSQFINYIITYPKSPSDPMKKKTTVNNKIVL